MPIARFQMPDGRIARFEVPDGTTPEQAQAMIAGQAEELTKPKAPAGMQTLANIGGGLVRGAGSIGATLLTPYDLLAGNTKSIGNPERRAAMEGGMQALGVDTDSLAYGGAKLMSEVAGTMGVGGGIANVVGRLAPAVAARAAPALDAVRTAGMSAGGVQGAQGLALRTAGAGATGFGAAGLVNPEDAKTGGMIGAAMPSALRTMQAAGGAAGRVLRGAEQSPELASAVTQARGAGYVIPPTQARPTLGNRILEGFSGKLTTAQNASAKNQSVTNRLAAEALGLPIDRPITPDAVKQVRTVAGQAYDAIGQSGTIRPTQAYNDALDKIVRPHLVAHIGFPNAKPSPVITVIDSLRTDVFDAASAVAKIKELRSAADDAFRTGNTDIGRASKAAANALEDAVEVHLQATGATDLLQRFKDARQLIAKTYTVEKALNPASGSVDARKLAAELKKGKPLSGQLKEAASFGLQFPKAAQAIEGMGSLPQTSPLDWVPAGALSMATSNPLLMMGVGARPAARAATLSPFIQNRLLQQPSGPGLLQNPEFQQLLLRGSPVAISSGGR